MIRLLQYHTRSFLSTNKFVMPLLSYIIILGILCSSTISSAKAIYIFSVVVVYFMATWSGFVYAESEDQITEQILILKAPSIIKYYISKVLFVMIWGLTYTVVGFIIPFMWKIVSLITKSNHFKDMTVEAVITSLFMHLCVAILGGVIGYLLHPRVFYNRKISAIATFSLAAIGIIKGPLFEELKIPAVKVVSWLFPPLYEIVQGCNMETATLSFISVLGPCIYALIYSVILASINIVVINKRGF